jgi:SAM-dependent methyltransferase
MDATGPAPTGSGEALFDLDELAEAHRLADWMFEQFEPFVGPTVVEVGPGVGTFSERLLAAGVERLILIEPEKRLVDVLEAKFGADPRVEIAHEGLPGSPTLAAAAGSAQFVLCQNVLEHIEADDESAAAMAAALAPGGRLGVLVPAHPRLYGALDRAYGHHRRYTRERLERVLSAPGLDLSELYSFNLLGVLGWLAKRRSREPGLGRHSLAVYERLLPLWRPIERRARLPWGLSLVAIARRPDAAVSRGPGT